MQIGVKFLEFALGVGDIGLQFFGGNQVYETRIVFDRRTPGEEQQGYRVENKLVHGVALELS
jgi:hypothetical protein